MTKKKSTAGKTGLKPGEPEIRCAGCHDLLNGKDFKTLFLSGTDGLYYEVLPVGHVNSGQAEFDPKCYKDELAHTEHERNTHQEEHD